MDTQLFESAPVKNFRLEILKKSGWKIAEAVLHIESERNEKYNLTIEWPSSNIKKLINSTMKIFDFKVFSKQCKLGLRDSDTQLRIELWKDSSMLESIHCRAIQGLPSHAT